MSSLAGTNGPAPSCFPFDSLRRYPDIEAPNLYAADAADRYLVQTYLNRCPHTAPTVLNDAYGALGLALAKATGEVPRSFTDLCTSETAIAQNALRLGVPVPQQVADTDEAADGARHVVLRLPRSLAQLDEQLETVARQAASDVVVLGAARVKHMSRGMNDVFARYFQNVQVSRAQQKSRIITATGLIRRGRASYPQVAWDRQLGLYIAAHGGVFAGAKVDIGTRALLGVLDDLPTAGTVVDLACGTGVLAAYAARGHPDARVLATDRSKAAIRSAAATAAHNGTVVAVDFSDAGAGVRVGSADVVLLNPPFHSAAAVHADVALKLFDGAARLLKAGGVLYTVFNKHLNYTRQLRRRVGETKTVSSGAKFTVTRSSRRPPVRSAAPGA